MINAQQDLTASSTFNPTLNHPLDSKERLTGFRIGFVAKIALHALAITFSVATAALFVATILTGVIPLAVLVVSSVALGVFLMAEAAPFVTPYLPVPMQRAIHLVRATVVDIFATLACSMLYPIKQTRFDPRAGSGNQTPILLIHGYMHNSSAWAYHRYHYNQAGFHNVFTVDLGHPFHSIEEYSAVIQDKMREIQEKTGCKDVRLVGHSMGGLVASHYALNHAQEDGVRVADLVTLGSPLKGTPMGYLGVGQCAKQMRYGSSFTSSQSKQLQESAIPRFHQGSKSDIIVFPYKTALNGAEDENSLVYDDLGHASFLFSDRVIRANIQRFRGSHAAVSV
jgi:triacylglycerol lipase